jgi:L-rhamnonate dehydratase
VKITTDSGHEGIATGLGGVPAIFLIKEHFSRFIVGADPRDMNLISEQMFRASMYYGRKGLAVSTISSIDLALWDLVGKIRG